MPLTQVQGGMLAGSTNTTTTIQSNGTTAITIDSSQNVGIGTTSPSFTAGGGLMVQNGTQANLRLDRFGEGGFELQSVASTLRFYSTAASAERMRIAADGFMLIGQTADNFPGAGNTVVGGSISNTGRLSFSANGVTCGYFNRNSSDGQLIRLARQGNEVGGINVTTTATTYATSSDYRLKENVAPMTGALATVAQLKPVTYSWKLDGSAGQGFIAHELQSVVPDCVTGEKDAVDEEGKPVYQGVDTSFLVATLTAAIQELNAKVEAQAAEIAALKAAP